MTLSVVNTNSLSLIMLCILPASSLIFFIIYNLPLGSKPILNQAFSCYDKSISFDACSAVHFAKTEPSASIDFPGLYDVEGYWQGIA